MIKTKKKNSAAALPEQVCVDLNFDDFESDIEEECGEMHLNFGVHIVNNENESIEDPNDDNYWSLLSPEEEDAWLNDEEDQSPPLVRRY